MLDALLSLSLADRFAVSVAILVVILGFLFVLSVGGPVIVSWTWRWCHRTFTEQATQQERDRLNAVVRMGERR